MQLPTNFLQTTHETLKNHRMVSPDIIIEVRCHERTWWKTAYNMLENKDSGVSSKRFDTPIVKAV